MIIMLASIFVYKLVQVQRSVDSVEGFVPTIAKQCILTLASIGSNTFFIVCMIPIALFVGSSVHSRLIIAILGSIDIYTNFLSIMLNYKYFGDYYHKLCRCCDSKCKDLWLRKTKEVKRQISLHVTVDSGS